MSSAAPSTIGVKGKIHSYESMGTLDGPGIRFVVFTQGCPLRCLYCHNPDCRTIYGGKEISAEEVLAEVKKYRSYLKGGGVTVSGGEPLMQPEFVTAIFQGCHDLGLHTALDTSGYCPIEVAQPVFDQTDLVLLDIKSFDPQIYQRVTHVSLEPTLAMARHNSNNAEFAMIIADRFQKQGLGTELLRRLVAIARSERIAQIEAYMLPGNGAMRKICERLEFQVGEKSDNGMVKAVLTIS